MIRRNIFSHYNKLFFYSILLTASAVMSAFAEEKIELGHDIEAIVEWEKKQSSVQSLAVLSNSFLGDAIDPHTGGLSFSHTDISLKGNFALPVSLTRARQSGFLYHDDVNAEFGDWSISVPRVMVTSVTERPWIGERCSKKTNQILTRFDGLRPLSYSNGLKVEMPGLGSQEILESIDNTIFPTEAVKVTKQYWYFTCIDATDGGEGLLGHAPNGDIYTFNHFYAIAAPDLGMIGADPKPRKIYILAATKVTDKNDNTVDYVYDDYNRLKTIEGSDGRLITLGYTQGSNLIKTATAAGKAWQYGYETNSYDLTEWMPHYGYPLTGQVLSKVTRPDGSTWLMALSNMSATPAPAGRERCEKWQKTVSLTHPNGATGTYTLQDTEHRHVFASKTRRTESCPTGEPDPITGPVFLPLDDDITTSTMAVTQKVITGANINDLEWTYEYQENRTKDDSAAGSGSSSTDKTNWTKVTAPDAFYVYKHAWVSEPLAGKLVNLETKSLDKDLHKVETYEYQHEERIGGSLILTYPGPGDLEKPVHTKKVIKTYGTDIYTQESTYDINQAANSATEYSYGNPTTITETFNGSTVIKVQNFDYLHQKETWLLGLLKTHNINSQPVLAKDYYDNGNTKKITRNNRLYATYEYHADGNVRTVKYNGPLAGSNQQRYRLFEAYEYGTPKKITLPNRYQSNGVAMTLEQAVDTAGNVTWKKDFNGVEFHYTYDLLDQLEAVDLTNDPTYGNWLDTLYEWNKAENIRTMTRCTLNDDRTECINKTARVETTAYYNNLLRLEKTKSVDILGSDSDSDNYHKTNTRYQRFEYNPKGQNTFTSFISLSPSETQGTRTQYDALGRTKSVVTTGQSPVLYNYLAGNKVRVTDAEYNVTTTTYQAFGDQSHHAAIKIESPEGVTTDIDINLFGNIDSIRQHSTQAFSVDQTETRLYNSEQQLCMVKRSDVGNTVFNYNTLGEITWQAQGVSGKSCTKHEATDEQKVRFTYDNLGSQRTISYDDGTPTRTFTLDNNGNIKTITGQGFTQDYNYNSLNLLEDETLRITGRSGTLKLDYGYNSLGHLASLDYPDGTASIAFAPNGFGQATQAIRGAVGSAEIFANNAQYYPSGSINTFTYGNGVLHKTHLNSRLMPKQITDKYGNQDRVNLSYEYDDNSNITKLTNTREAGIYSLTKLSYDGLDRLKTTTGGSGIGSSALAYDGLGNIRSYSNTSSFDAHDLTYSYSSDNRLSSVVKTGNSTKVRDFSASNSYDARGNVLKNGNRDSDAINSFSYNLANQMTEAGSNRYVYDGYNRRIKTTDSKGTSYSMYSQAGKLLYRETPDGGINYVFLGSKLIAKEGVGVKASDDSIMHYKPFGDSIETPKDDVGYTGHKFDTDLGLSYMQARYYDPVIGRFYSNDPVGTTGHDSVVHGFNRYAYANNNPYKYTDPSGEIPLVVVAIWILKEVGGEVFEQTTGIPAPTVKNAAKYGLKKAMKHSIKNRKKIAGVYKFKEGDKDYIGQSQDVMKRLKQHASTGKLKEGKAGTVTTKKVDGGKTQRERTEQGMIDKATDGEGAKSPNVTNKVNPCRREGC